MDNNNDNVGMLLFDDLLLKAIERFGERAQTIKCLEEMCEFGVELHHLLKKPDDYGSFIGVKDTEKAIDECVDVFIMVHQMINILGVREFDKRLHEKVARLNKLVLQ